MLSAPQETAPSIINQIFLLRAKERFSIFQSLKLSGLAAKNAGWNDINFKKYRGLLKHSLVRKKSLFTNSPAGRKWSKGCSGSVFHCPAARGATQALTEKDHKKLKNGIKK